GSARRTLLHAAVSRGYRPLGAGKTVRPPGAGCLTGNQFKEGSQPRPQFPAWGWPGPQLLPAQLPSQGLGPVSGHLAGFTAAFTCDLEILQRLLVGLEPQGGFAHGIIGKGGGQQLGAFLEV